MCKGSAPQRTHIPINMMIETLVSVECLSLISSNMRISKAYFSTWIYPRKQQGTKLEYYTAYPPK